MLLQNYDSKESILENVSSKTFNALRELKSWFYPYIYNPLSIERLNTHIVSYFPLFKDTFGLPTHASTSLFLSTPAKEDYEKIKQKIENDDSQNNYIFHIQTKETLMENIKLDASLHLKLGIQNKKTEAYDHATASFIAKNSYSYLDKGVTNFYKVDTYYHHWQLKDNILLDPINKKDIAFINNTKILSLDTTSNKVSELCDFRHKIVNFDINENYIVACGYRVMSSYPREYTSLFFNKFDQPLGRPSERISSKSSLGKQIFFISSDEENKHYMACTKEDIDRGTINKGVIFVHNRKTGITYEFSVGSYMNNTAKILDSTYINDSEKENFLLTADLKVLVTNNDGSLYYLAFSNLDFEIIKIKMLIAGGNFSYESLNNIAISDTSSHVVITTDSNYFMSFSMKQLIESLQNTTKSNSTEFVLSNTIHYASSGSFAMNAIFLKKSAKVMVSYQNGRIHIVDLSNSGIQNIILPFREFEEAIRNVVVDSKNNIYISQSSGAVHIYTNEQLLADSNSALNIVVSHNQLNFPKTSYLHHLVDTKISSEELDPIDNEYGFIKHKIAPYLTTSYDLYNTYAWLKDRNNVINREKTSEYAHTLSAIFLDCVQDDNEHTLKIVDHNTFYNLELGLSLQSKLRNEIYEQLFELERLVMLEKDNLYVGILRENEVKINRYYNSIAKLYPETYARIMNMCDCDLTQLLPFDKIMTRSYTPYKYDLNQYAKLDILKRDSTLFKAYRGKFPNKNKNLVINKPDFPKDYIISDKIKIESKCYEELIVDTQNERESIEFKKSSFGEKLGEYEDYQFSILNAFKSVKMDKKHRFEDRPNNKITGMSIRLIDHEEQLVVGTSTGIYTIPI